MSSHKFIWPASYVDTGRDKGKEKQSIRVIKLPLKTKKFYEAKNNSQTSPSINFLCIIFPCFFFIGFFKFFSIWEKMYKRCLSEAKKVVYLKKAPFTLFFSPEMLGLLAFILVFLFLLFVDVNMLSIFPWAMSHIL